MSFAPFDRDLEKAARLALRIGNYRAFEYIIKHVAGIRWHKIIANIITFRAPPRELLVTISRIYERFGRYICNKILIKFLIILSHCEDSAAIMLSKEECAYPLADYYNIIWVYTHLDTDFCSYYRCSKRNWIRHGKNTVLAQLFAQRHPYEISPEYWPVGPAQICIIDAQYEKMYWRVISRIDRGMLAIAQLLVLEGDLITLAKHLHNLGKMYKFCASLEMA